MFLNSNKHCIEGQESWRKQVTLDHIIVLLNPSLIEVEEFGRILKCVSKTMRIFRFYNKHFAIPPSNNRYFPILTPREIGQMILYIQH